MHKTIENMVLWRSYSFPSFHFRLNAGFGVEPLLKDVKIINSQDVEADNLLVMIIIDITTRKTAAASTTEIS